MRTLSTVIAVLTLAVPSVALAGQKRARPHRLRGLYKRGARVIWGAECRGPEGQGLAFGGEHLDADDGRPHTRVLEGGVWKAIHVRLRANNPLQKLHDRAWKLRCEAKDVRARARFIYFKGRPAAEEAAFIKKEIDPRLAELVKDLDALAAELGKAGGGEYEKGQAAFALKHVGAAKPPLGPVGASVTAAKIKAMRGAQLRLGLAAEALDAEPPPRTLSPLVYDAKTRLYVIFGGDHLDYITNDTWVYDPAKKRWSQRHPATAPAPRGNHKLTAGGDGKVKLSGGYKYSSNTDYCGGQYLNINDGDWVYDVEKNAWTGGGKLLSPDSREYRTGPFHPDFYLQGAKPNAAAWEAKLKSLPVNQWTVANPPYKPRLNRDWGTAIIDPDRDMMLRWSGGHSAHGGTDVPHYHFGTNRWEMPFPVEFPLDCLYSNTTYPGGFNLNKRPWMTGHTYQGYDYDPVSRKMVMTGRPRNFYVYDPDIGDWTGRGPKPKGMAYRSCFYTLTVCPTPKGALCWGQGLFLYAAKAGSWKQLATSGEKLGMPSCDRSGSVYDAKRDRVLFVKSARKVGFDGQVYALDLKTLALSKLNPAGREVARNVAGGYVRETCYDRANDALVIGGLLAPGADKARPTLVYDCAKNRWLALKITGKNPADPRRRGGGRNVSQGLMYDAKRKLIWSTDTNSQVYVLRLDVKKAGKVDLKAVAPPAGKNKSN